MAQLQFQYVEKDREVNIHILIDRERYIFIYIKREREIYMYIYRERYSKREREREIKFLIAHFYIPFPLNTIDEYKARDIDKHGI